MDSAQPRRTLGRSGLEVSAQGFGCMSIANTYGKADDSESVELLRHAIDLGVTFFDAADIYGRGLGEELLGRAIRGRRDEVVVATKCGLMAGPAGVTVNGSAGYIKQCCDASLKRLNVDVIDLFYLHRVDPVIPIEESVTALAELVAAGKVRHLGLSEAGASTLRRAAAVHPIAALQSEWSLWTRDIEAEILPAARELGIGLVAFCPLGRGMLAAKVEHVAELPEKDPRRKDPRFVGANFERHRAIASRLSEMASARAVEPAQLAIAWLLMMGPDVVPIPGTKHQKYLEMNAQASGIALSPAEHDELSALVPPELSRALEFQVPGAPARGFDPTVTWA
jgi:aryl-alcohol dehydrogenase-like predicted oxidoreductase